MELDPAPLQPHPPGGRYQKQEVLQTCSLTNRDRKSDKMRWQRNMFHMKEQDKTPEEQLSEVKIGNLPGKEFRVMIVKMIQDLGEKMEASLRIYKKYLTKS